MAETAKLHLVELSRRSLLRGAACAEGGARIMLLVSRPNEAPLPQDVAAHETPPTHDEAAAAKPS
jgi:hypothetical protein